ncbi:MAG: hypothetical protein E7162_01665 [Firmicutes bacterium]|nr:hypothetical protein [Bacillota bacterium]
MKMTLSKLIANDIINYGMNQTSNFNYSVFLDSYIDDFDEDSKKYILDNLGTICEDIRVNENISYFNFKDETKEFDMVFYWDGLLNNIEKFICNIIKVNGVKDDFELYDIKNIAVSLLSDEQTKNLAIEKIRNVKSKDYEL